MEFEEEDYNQITNYNLGNLSEAENAEIEKRMQMDKVFREEVLLHQRLPYAISEKGWPDWGHENNEQEIEEIKALKRSDLISNIESKIKSSGRQYFENQNKHRKGWRKYAVGLVAALVIVFVSLRIFNFNSVSGESLYAEYVDWENNLLSTTEQSNFENRGLQGEQLFKKEEYKKAKIVFIDIIEKGKRQDSHTLMYLGASYLELEEYNDALQVFDQLLQQKSLNSNRAYWYKSMVYLKQGDISKAKEELLSLIKNKENFNYTKARELLKQLD
ncbi:tetratricopeptide repeat protein [uncultured Aquimarina sp.]|uniref:tetratricopeptide repeat protein n=1 Tax=uncultured Aquimarina sp. TaxID=575652 RepID=UPI002633F153|nr:tetratricopeptide repeat protein [uncultured Aquimarina sp.]